LAIETPETGRQRDACTNKKTATVPSPAATFERWKTVLGRCKKAELVEVIVSLARDDQRILRRLQTQFGGDVPPPERIAATRQAIADATAFDAREMNSNFDYDYQAYETVQRNFGCLVASGHLREVMELSLELMRRGSQQVEMSDEGMMTCDIEECLAVVGKALKKCDLPSSEIIQWCRQMAENDRVGFIHDAQLRELQRRHESP